LVNRGSSSEFTSPPQLFAAAAAIRELQNFVLHSVISAPVIVCNRSLVQWIGLVPTQISAS
jgi:hypothetical protein